MAKRGQGEGTIVKRPDGRWMAQISTGHDPLTGKLKRVTYYGKTRQEVAEKLAKAQHEKNTGAFVEPNKITVGQWLDRWLIDYMKPLRLTTWNSYEALIRQHIKPAAGGIPLTKLTPGDLQRFYNSKLEKGRLDGEGGLSARTIRYLNTIIHAALKQAMREGLVYRNVAEAVTLPKQQKKELKPLTGEQTQKMLVVAKGERLYPAFLTAVYTGLRRGELLALRWQDVDLEKQTIKVRQSVSRTYVKGAKTKTRLICQEPKTELSKRTIPIPDEVMAALKEHKKKQNEEKLFLGQAYQNDGLVFATEEGKLIEPRNLARKFETLLRAAGLPKIKFHGLRHGFATMLLEANEHPKNVQILLGHSTITTTLDIYSHVDIDIKKKAVEKISAILNKEKIPKGI